MEALLDPVDFRKVEEELKNEKFLRVSGMGNNEIYVVNGINSPNTMNEIGRLREFTFRHAGGGTGASKDIDQFDIKKNGYKQLIVWDPHNKYILGGYRFRSFDKDIKIDINQLATGEVYNLSGEFQNEYLQHSIDLGRAFIKPIFQTKQKRKGEREVDDDKFSINL